MTSDILDDIKKEILSKLPKSIQVSKVEFEGPEVVVYTKNPEIITENGDLIRSLAKEFRKRIIIRSDKSALLEPEHTIEKVHEIVPDGAEITDIYFDTGGTTSTRTWRRSSSPRRTARVGADRRSTPSPGTFSRWSRSRPPTPGAP